MNVRDEADEYGRERWVSMFYREAVFLLIASREHAPGAMFEAGQREAR